MKQLLKVCHEHKLYDRIDDRKLHNKKIPRLGGIIFLPATLSGFLCAILVLRQSNYDIFDVISTSSISIGIAMTAIYLIGVADDIAECNAKLKFAIQICAAQTFPLCGLYINNLYGFLGIQELPLFIAYPLTVFITVLIINAINLIDGIDGLAASLTLFALIIFGWQFHQFQLPIFEIAIAALIGSLLTYIPYNMWGSNERGTKTFMGDSGSLLLGITLAYLMMKLSMKNTLMPEVGSDSMLIGYSALLIPCFDLTRVALCRIKRRQGIFSPDKTHIHHKIMAMGVGMHHTLCIILIIQAAFFALNMALNNLGVANTWIVGIDILIYTILNLYLPTNIKPKRGSETVDMTSKGQPLHRKKILHLSKYYYPYMGGLEDVCKSIIESTMEHEHMVLCFNDKKDNVDETINGVRVFRVGLLREIARQPLSLSYNSIMRRIIQNYHPDIIHLHAPNPLASILCLMNMKKGMKLIVHWHSDIIVQPLLHAIFSPFERMLLKRADAIIATSPNYIEGSELLRLYSDKCTVIPNTVATSKLDDTYSEESVKSLKEKYGKFVFFVGRHVTYKGIEYLIDAARELGDNVNVLIAGKGPLTSALIDRAAGLSNVHFIGRIPDEVLGNYMRACTVFAFPSITKNEAFGVVLAEAMYCGAVPVCFTIYGSGVNWVNINGRTGIVVKNRNVKKYAEAILSLINDDELRQMYSNNAIERVKTTFLSDHIKPIIHNIYTNVVNNNRAK